MLMRKLGTKNGSHFEQNVTRFWFEEREGKRAFFGYILVVSNPSCTNDKINLCHKEDRSAGRQQQFNELPLFLTFQL